MGIRKAWFLMAWTLFAMVMSCKLDIGGGFGGGSGGALEKDEAPVEVPWGPGEDCRNWGCNENSAQFALPPPNNAQICTTNGECGSGFCVDGVCCDTACTGTCNACTAAKKGQGADGTCGAIALYADPDNECPNAACDGTGLCKSYNGVTCGAASTCLSGYCADGYCCGAACTGTCFACSVAKRGSGFNGQCGAIAVNTDPDNECTNSDCNGSGACSLPTNLLNGNPCTLSSQCASGYCVDGFCCGNACTEPCKACSAAKRGGGYDGQCGYILGNTDPDNECVGGDCNGTGACTTPQLQANGSACSESGQCSSGFCVDGVCCDQACTGTCQACTAAKKYQGIDGACGMIATGKNPDGECKDGICNGTGSCQGYNGATCSASSQCLSGFCADGFCCGAACTETCRACSAAKKGGGFNGQCGVIAVNTDPDDECPTECNGSGACISLLANGSACTAGSQCNSTYCVDGVCCDKACAGTCEACTATKKGSGTNGTCGFIANDTNPDNECVNGKCGGSGTCKSYNGITCSTTAQCLSNYCVDGVCCGAACTGACQACSGAKKGSGFDGQCGNIGSGSDPDNECFGACNGSGVCLLAANGDACSAGAQCTSGFCVDGVCCDSACSGLCQACTMAKKGSGSDGTCGVVAVGSDPDAECGSGGCDGVSGCFGASDGSSCTSDVQCLSGHCADGICCNTACTETCMACNEPGSIGVCSNVPLGQPDSNAATPCSGTCDGDGVCKSANGAACTSGSQCLSRICDNGTCAAVTPPQPLAWMTVLSDSNSSGYIDVQALETSAAGGVGATGRKQGFMNLGIQVLDVCCWLAGAGFSFDGAGFPISIGDWWMNDYNNEYTVRYARQRYDNVSVTRHNWHSGPAHSMYTSLDAPTWGRGFYQTDVGVIASDQGHVLIGATIFPDDQNVLHPVDFGDGNLVTDARLVKYDPTGQVVFNVPSITLTVGSVIDPNGAFYDFERASGAISITKQDPMGNALWTKSYSAGVAAAATPALAQVFDDQGNILLAFNFQGTATFDMVSMTSTGIHDLGLVKLDTDGNPLWIKHYGTPTFDLKTVDMDPTGSAEMAVRGTFAGTADLGQGAFTTTPFIAKFDSTGTVEWQAPSPIGTFSVRGSESGAVFVVSGSDTADFGWGAPLSGDAGIIVAKYGPCADPSQCRPPGATCSTNTQCDSGFCVDGFCCESACSGLCEACSTARKGSGSNGTCGPIASGVDPDNECTNSACSGTGVCAQYNGVACASPAECLSGYCVDGVCCGGACVGLCQACTAAKKGSGADGGCGNIGTGADPDDECGTGTCSGAGVCSMGSAGVTCTANGQCASGFCADGVCCNNACTGTCQACTAAKKGSGTNGTCGTIAAYADPDNECYQGTCNGSGACIAGANGNLCSTTNDCTSGFCVDGICCNSACTGLCQACSTAKKGSGANGTCGNIAYDVDPDNECTNGACSGSGVCQSSTGMACNGSLTCLSGYCVDGVCCEAACSALCQACSATKKGSGFDGVCEPIAIATDPDNECGAECNGSGACTPAPNGASCSLGTQCLSGFCVDGVCCNNACSGICEACSVAKKGSGTQGQCGAIDAGKDPDNECAATCDGAGSCAPPPVLLGNGAACSAGSQCTSDHCIDGVCCDSSCYETCKSCNKPGLVGTCSAITPTACNACSGILGHTSLPFSSTAATDIAVADLNGDGILDMASVVSSVNEVHVKLGVGNGAFETYGAHATGTSPQAVAVADLNGDQTQDIVVTNGNDDTVSVLFNSGAGVFAAKVDYATGTNPRDLFLGDVNGDGFKDIVVGNYASNNISVLLGNGTGAFATKIDTTVSGLKPRSMAAADFTGDGVLDLAVTNNYPSLYPRLWILRGSGNGTFAYFSDYPLIDQFYDSYGQSWVVAGDFNDDGLPDVAIATDTSSAGDTRVLFNQGGGVFGNLYHVFSQGLPSSITAGDLNGDGKLDVAWTTDDRGFGVYVLLNAGAGTFNRTFYGVGSYVETSLTADIDGDGDSDIVMGGYYGVGVLKNPGNGTFDDDSFDGTWNAIEDLNGDGKLDAVVMRTVYPDYKVTPYLNQGNNTFVAGSVFDVWLNIDPMLVDVNGDSRKDLVYQSSQGNALTVHINNGSGVFGVGTSYTIESFPTTLLAADVSGDNKPDLVVVNTYSSNLSVLLNNGNGSFAAKTNYVTGGNPGSVVIVDLTGDGKRDIAVPNESTNTVSILRNNGNGTFAAKVDYPTGKSPQSLVAADVNGDNILDLVLRTTGASNSKNIDFALNQGNGTFALVNFANVSSGGDFVVQDLSADGKPDIAFTNNNGSSGSIDVRLNLGSGVFGTTTTHPMFPLSYGTLIGSDLNGDGTTDLQISGGFPAHQMVLFNHGDGVFRSSVNYATSRQVYADLNGDGIQDTLRADATTVTARYGICLP